MHRLPLIQGPTPPSWTRSSASEFLIETLQEERETILIPTPALSEVPVHAGDAGPQYLEILDSSRWFRIVPFDHRAAVELAAITRDAIAAGDLRAGTGTTRAKLKFDRQIIAVARVEGQATVCSDDEDTRKPGAPPGLTVIAVHELPHPPEAAQGTLDPWTDDNGWVMRSRRFTPPGCPRHLPVTICPRSYPEFRTDRGTAGRCGRAFVVQEAPPGSAPYRPCRYPSSRLSALRVRRSVRG